MKRKNPGLAYHLRCLAAAALVVSVDGQNAPKPWLERDTRLANEYLSLLVQQPEYGRVIELLWTLYEKHESTKLLVENVAAQAASSKHPSVLLVHGHLLRRAGDLKAAATKYDEVLKLDVANVFAIRSRADVAVDLKKPEEALELLKRLAETSAETAVWIEIGNLSLGIGKNAEAAEAWEKAARMQPEDFTLARQVAQLLLQAGFPERAAAFFSKLADQKDPQRRLDALYDLARIYEHADQFAAADRTLRDGLVLLHFRDGRYFDFFRRRVRLHERFGMLDDLQKALLAAAKAQPPSEQALWDATRFFDLTVDVDEQVKWLRELVKTVPQVEDYRWELVRALLDHEGAAEAAKLLDERLKNDGSDLPSLVMLRCEADLRGGDSQAAVARLVKLLEAQTTVEAEKQVLVFAQTRSLDVVIEKILRGRVDRDPQKTEAVFELAAYYRARRDAVAEDKLLREFTSGAATDVERQKRLGDAAAFLASSNNLDSAIMLARESVAKPDAGRDAWLRLADLLAEQGDNDEAAEWIEKAWLASTTDEERIDTDERLFSILMGGKDETAKKGGKPAEFTMPNAFTGAGFGSDEPENPEQKKFPEAVEEKARKLAAAAGRGNDAERFRALWWAVRAQHTDEGYAILRGLEFDAKGRPRPLSAAAEQLKLDLAVADENLALQERQLKRLIESDAAGRVRHTLRLSELLLESERRSTAEVGGAGWRMMGSSPVQGLMAAKLLERAQREMPDSEPILSALTQVYLLQRRTEDVLALWKQAVKQAEGATAAGLMERHADLLLRLNRLEDFVQTQALILERETDIKRRREMLGRCVDRLTFSDANGGELAPNVIKDRLRLVEKALRSLLQRHPFDGFYHEALAMVAERQGDHATAFASMKQAYYTAPETPFSLAQLREAALKVGDLKSAIYFQRQIAAASPPQELAAESRRLVELLEQTFQIDEADRVRRRLESRFSQDVKALNELARHYQTTGQDEAEKRVYEQVVKVQSWDSRSLLRLALKCLRFADTAAAEKHLEQILALKTKVTITRSGMRGPLPLSDGRKSGGKSSMSELAPLLDFAPGIERAEIERLRAFLSMPRPEFADVPEDAALVRLRAIEELSKLKRQSGGKSCEAWITRWNSGLHSDWEKLWALYYSGEGAAFRRLLHNLLKSDQGTLEGQFCLLWMNLRSHGMSDVMAWAAPGALMPEVIAARERLVHACVSMLVDAEGFHFTEDELRQLGGSKVMRTAAIWDVTDKLKGKQRYHEALALGEGLPRQTLDKSSIYALFLARIAESAEDWTLARHHLQQAVNAPLLPEAYRSRFDTFLSSFSSLQRVAGSRPERDAITRDAWRRLQRSTPSDLTVIRQAAVQGVAGADDAAAKKLGGFFTRDFTTTRQMSDGRGNLMPQGSSRYEEAQHVRSLWEETRELQMILRQQGLGNAIKGTNAELEQRWGTTMLAPRSDTEFGEWRIHALLSKLRPVDYPTRLRLIREHLASVDMRTEHSVDTLGNLGSRLESAGMSREAVMVYRQLPDRAPSNPDYAQWLLRACENSGDVEPGASFAHHLLIAEAPNKPPAIGDEVLREKHALFLARDFNLDELRRQAFREKISQVLAGREPHEIPYLKAYALLQERMGNLQAALQAWQHLKAVFAANDQSGHEFEAEGNLHLAKLLQRLARPKEAVHALRAVPVKEPLSALMTDTLDQRVRLAVGLGDWKEMGELKVQAVELKSLPTVLVIARELATHERRVEALNFLTQAERTLKDDHQRFTLRLEQLTLLSQDGAWSPERDRARLSALFRTPTRDRDTLVRLLEWLKKQSEGPHAAGWVRVLRAEAAAGSDRAAAALALSAFAPILDETTPTILHQAWAEAIEKDRLCIELTAQRLLEGQKPAWAREACRLVASIPTLRENGRKLPLTIRVAQALNDEAEVRELFNETLRMPFPGGGQTVAWALALEETGHANLARELFDAALRQIEAGESLQSEIHAAWTRFLIRQKDFDAAESFLMRMHWAMPGEAAKLVFELHAAWGKLSNLDAELPKYRLPTGTVREATFLAKQQLDQASPPP